MRQSLSIGLLVWHYPLHAFAGRNFIAVIWIVVKEVHIILPGSVGVAAVIQVEVDASVHHFRHEVGARNLSQDVVYIEELRLVVIGLDGFHDLLFIEGAEVLVCRFRIGEFEEFEGQFIVVTLQGHQPQLVIGIAAGQLCPRDEGAVGGLADKLIGFLDGGCVTPCR